jgi:hypothetical protein
MPVGLCILNRQDLEDRQEKICRSIRGRSVR